MCKKLVFLVCVVFMLGLGSSRMAFADNVYWDNDANNNLFNDPLNWVDDNMPGTDDNARIDMAEPDHCLIDSTMNIEVGRIYVGADANGTLFITGGNVDAGRFYIGYKYPVVGKVEMSGGTVKLSSKFMVGIKSTGVFLMTGGSFTTTGKMILAENKTCVSYTYLYGGTITADDFEMRETEGDPDSGIAFMDIKNDGKLVLGESSPDFVSTIWSYIDRGWLYADGGDGYLKVDVIDGDTVVTAYGPPELNEAWYPSPRDHTADIGLDAVLSWISGDPCAPQTAQHDVYLSTNFSNVKDAADANSPFCVAKDLDVNSYAPPGGLQLGRTYYWRVDGHAPGEHKGVLKGEIWAFNTIPFISVDDMESYDDANNLIYNTWKDYHSQSGNPGAAITLINDDDFARSGDKCMSFYYDNDWYDYSETEREYTSPQNWTIGSAKALTLYFRGDPCNVPDQMYVALEDGTNSKQVPYSHDINNLLIDDWQEWNIALSDFSDGGVDVTNVKKVKIGFIDNDGYGTVYFDDIRLYPSRCVKAYDYEFGRLTGDITGDCIVDTDDLEDMQDDWLAYDYNAVGLIARYSFEDAIDGNTVADTSGYGTPADGNIIDGAVLVDDPGDANKPASRVLLSGPGYVDCGNAPKFDVAATRGPGHGGGEVTVSSWFKVDMFTDEEASIVTKGDGVWMMQKNGDGPWMQFNSDGRVADEDVRVDDGKWHYVAGVQDQDNTYLYLDGVLVEFDEGGDGDLENNEEPVLIGANSESPGRRWPGYIDEVRIYNRALSPAEILVDMSGAIPPEANYPVASDAELYTKEPLGSRVVNFKDFAILANDWLSDTFWP